jgi:hypothetical protein
MRFRLKESALSKKIILIQVYCMVVIPAARLQAADNGNSDIYRADTGFIEEIRPDGF